MFFDLWIVDFGALQGRHVEPVKVSMPACSFAAVSTDLGLVIIQDSESSRQVGEVGAGSDGPSPSIPVDHSKIFHGCQSVVGG